VYTTKDSVTVVKEISRSSSKTISIGDISVELFKGCKRLPSNLISVTSENNINSGTGKIKLEDVPLAEEGTYMIKVYYNDSTDTCNTCNLLFTTNIIKVSDSDIIYAD
jgi:hypothetical protein